MNKKLSLIAFFSFFLMAAALPLEAKIQIPDTDEEYFEIDIDEAASDTHFFLEDANEEDFEISFGEASSPSVIPCQGTITSNYGWRRISRRHGRLHKGVDIAAPVGTPIVAPADAKVAFVGRKGGYGWTLILDHGGKLTTLYGHTSEIFVNEGDAVRKGQEVARIGMSGHSTGPHVHYEVRVDGNPVNPSRFF